MTSRPPNMRVQRTRSSASTPHSPLTRHPLGRTMRIVVAIIAGLSMPSLATEPAPPPPTMENLAGAWIGIGSGGDIYRLYLDKNGTGVAGSTTQGEDSPVVHLFQVDEWGLSMWQLSLAASAVTPSGAESLSISGSISGAVNQETLDLTVSATYGKRWRGDSLRMTREAPTLEGVEAVRRAMNATERR